MTVIQDELRSLVGVRAFAAGLALAATSVTSYNVLEEPSRQWIHTWEHRRRQRRSAATTMDTEGGT